MLDAKFVTEDGWTEQLWYYIGLLGQGGRVTE